MAQERLRRNNKHAEGDNGHSNRYVFSGKIKCGECGFSFVSRVKKLSDGTAIRRWSCGTAASEGASVCDVGKLVRDDDAIHMLKTAIQSLKIDTKSIVGDVTDLTLAAIQTGEHETADQPELLKYEIDRTERKKEAAMDSFFSGDISKEDMQTMKQKYERQAELLYERLVRAEERQKMSMNTQKLKSDIQTEVEAILSGETESEVFYKTLLDGLTVFKDRHMELRLKYLPQVFRFTG